MSRRRVSIACFASLFLGLVFAGFPLTLLAQTGAPPTIIQGTVSDQTTSAAIAGALLKWNDLTHKVTGTTDSNGNYAFAIPLVRAGQCESVTVLATGNTYAQAKRVIKICDSATMTVNFLLTPLPASQIGTVSGQLVGSLYGKFGIANATVSISKLSLPVAGLTTTTDANGFYSIPGVGFASGLTMHVTTEATPCIAPITKTFSLSASQLTLNFSVKALRGGVLECPGSFWTPEPPLQPAASAPAAQKRLRSHPQALLDSGIVPQPNLSTDPAINWQVASVDGILMNPGANSWNSGHVNGIVIVSPNEVVVGANMSGVWNVAWSGSSAAATPVSFYWPSLSVEALSQGVDGSQDLYAGTIGHFGVVQGGFLFETDTSSIAPLVNWLPDTKPNCNDIWWVLPIVAGRRIVLACDNGVWWSPIPPPPAAHGTYTWKQAIAGPGVPASVINGGFMSLAEGPVLAGTQQVNIVAAAGGAGVSPKSGKPTHLFLVGSWTSTDLVLSNATIASFYPTTTGGGPGRTSIAVCALDPNQMYAVTNNAGGATDGNIGAVWMSQNGGQEWTTVNLPPADAGNQGDYNQSIAVNPSDCTNFAIAWRSHVYISYDSGTSYTALDSTCGGDETCLGNLHGDYHFVTYDPNNNQTLWVGHDGGLTSASNVFMGSTPAFSSIYNEHLYDLEIFTATASGTAGTPNGNAPWGLAAGVTQDNGALYNDLGGTGWWNQLADSDGVSVAFSGAGPATPFGSPGDTLVFSDSSDTTVWTSAIWNGTSMPITGPVPPNIDAGGPAALAEVRGPRFINSAGELMYAIGTGASNQNIVFGLFSDPVGGDLHWEQIGDIGAGLSVSALSSTDGTTVFAGTGDGKIFTFAPQDGAAMQWPINAPVQGSVQAIAEILPSIAFAAFNNGSSSGFVASFDGTSWSAVGGGLPTNLPYLAASAPNLGTIVVANVNAVFSSHDGGSTWLLASNGLPVTPMILGGSGPEPVRWAVQSDGLVHMYLASRGWSLFQAVLPAGSLLIERHKQ